MNPSGILCRKTARKMIHPSQFGNHETGRDGDSVEESVDQQADQDGIAFVADGANSSLWVSSPKWKCGVTVCSKK